MISEKHEAARHQTTWKIQALTSAGSAPPPWLRLEPPCGPLSPFHGASTEMVGQGVHPWQSSGKVHPYRISEHTSALQMFELEWNETKWKRGRVQLPIVSSSNHDACRFNACRCIVFTSFVSDIETKIDRSVPWRHLLCLVTVFIMPQCRNNQFDAWAT